MNENRILVIVPHPDDEVIGAGGLIIKELNKGARVNVLCLAPLGGYKDFNNKELVVEKRKDEFIKVCEILSIEDYKILNYKSGKLDYNEIKKIIIMEIRKFKPKTVLFPSSTDLHIDHSLVSDIVLKSLYYSRIDAEYELGLPWRVSIALMYEVLNPINPDIIIDISDEFEKKIEIVKLYKTQISKRVMKFIKSLAIIRGYQIKKSYGEGYRIPKGWPMNGVY